MSTRSSLTTTTTLALAPPLPVSPSPSRPRSLALTIPSAPLPDVFVTPPEGGTAFCAFDARMAAPSPPPSPSAPDLDALEEALRFLQEAAPRPKLGDGGPVVWDEDGAGARMLEEMGRASCESIGEGESWIDLGDEDVPSPEEVEAEASTPSTPRPRTLSKRASQAFKKALGGSCASSPAPAPSPQAPAPAPADPLRSKSRTFLPNLFGHADIIKEKPSVPAEPPLQPSRGFRTSLFRRQKKDSLAPPPKADGGAPTLRRRPFSVLNIGRRSRIVAPKSPSLPPASPRASISSGNPSTVESDRSSSTYVGGPPDPQSPTFEKKARIDSFHFDNTTLFDPYSYPMR